MINRLRVTYVFWKALGAKNHNAVLAMIHECGFADIASGYLDVKDAEAMDSDLSSALNSESNSVGGYDGHRMV
ncbi:MAG: hypothetical protein GWP10_18625 [Nitrospiraceae bacterium]|nr:hypothetical protein [Nitrospiraceae bacterium]